MNCRYDIPKELWQLVTTIADRLEATPEVAWRALLVQIVDIVTSNPKALGPLAAAAKQTLDRVVEEEIDYGKLHTSTKTKSGYTGVYVNGQGFRAMGRDPTKNGEPMYLGTFPSAQLAAWRRYQHYAKHNLPYGELEIDVDRYRQQYGRNIPDEEAITQVLDLARMTGTLHIYDQNVKPRPPEGTFEEIKRDVDAYNRRLAIEKNTTIEVCPKCEAEVWGYEMNREHNVCHACVHMIIEEKSA